MLILWNMLTIFLFFTLLQEQRIVFSLAPNSVNRSPLTKVLQHITRMLSLGTKLGVSKVFAYGISVANSLSVTQAK